MATSARTTRTPPPGRASCEGWWSFCNARPWLAGGFIWTGFDYRGEPSPYGWPNISSQYGIIDTCGFPKDSFYYFQAWWTGKPVLHLFPHWNWPGLEGQEIAVWVYSNLDRVELFLNGQSLGAKEMKKDSHLAWNVKYAPGAIEARGFKDGKQVMTAKRETTGPAAKLVLARGPQGDFGGWRGCGHVRGGSAGRAGPRTCRVADNEVTFQVAGSGQPDRRRQRRPDLPRIRQGHFAKGLLRAVHGDRAIHQGRRATSRSRRLRPA